MNPTETKTPPPPAKLGKWVVIVFILLVVGLAFGYLPRLRSKKELVTETDILAVATVQVVNAVPGKGTATLTLPAELKSIQETPIYARANGYVKRWYVDIGGAVTPGQLLADVDTPELDQQLSGIRAELVQAEAAMALAKVTADRWAELLKTSSVSDQENAEKQADLKLKMASVDTAKANVHRLEDLQSFTHVTAPFGGILTLRNIDVGDLISSGKELFRLADTRKLRIFVRVPQTYTLSIAVGLTAEMILPESPAHKYIAKVVRTAGAIDVNSRTLLTELEVDNKSNEILPGSYAQVSFNDLKQDPALILPANTLLFRSEGLQVGVVTPENRVQLHSVVMGRDFGRSVEILSGITMEDRVIVNPPDALVSDIKVNVAAETKPVAKP